MGLFSGLKNYLTGGGAEVSLDPFTIQLGGEARPVRVNIKVKENDIKSNEVYLRLRCTYFCHEHELEWKDTDNDQKPDKLEVRSGKITGSVRYEKVVMDSSPTYLKNTVLSFQQPVSLGNDHLPFISDKIVWAAMAGIDTSGNDPDSDWMEIFVSNPIITPEKTETTLALTHQIGDAVFQIQFTLNFAFGITDLEKFYFHFGKGTDLRSREILNHVCKIFEVQLLEILLKKLPDSSNPKIKLSGFEIFKEILTDGKSGLALWYFDITSIRINQKG